jgi:uncharacterized protein
MKRILLLIVVALLFSGCSKKTSKVLDFPNPRQSYDYSCGPGAVQAVMAYYGEDYRESQLIELLKTDKNEGTYVKDIVKFLHSRGLSTNVKERMTKNELFHYIDKDIPVIVLIQAWGKEPDFNNHYKDCWNDGHFVVVIGYTDEDIICADPGLFKPGYIPINEFIERWHDYDEGDTKTYQLGIAVYGKKPAFVMNNLERIK